MVEQQVISSPQTIERRHYGNVNEMNQWRNVRIPKSVKFAIIMWIHLANMQSTLYFARGAKVRILR